MAKKYLEVFNDGSQDLYILDRDAQDAIGIDTTHEFVDLGLPSGTLWAKCNVGATVETGYGNYYMYGKADRQYNSEDTAYAGTENPLDPTKDTATVVLGAPWHMPTKTQYDELVANTVYSWEENFNNSGINGGKFTATNGNYVFFPAAGYWNNGSQGGIGDYCGCWTSTPYGTYARQILLGSDGASANASNSRLLGLSIRPVCDTAPLNKVAPDKVFTGAGASADGERGLVPAPAAGDNNKFLRGDGTWSDEMVNVAFSGTTLVFYSGGYFDGDKLMIK